MAGKRDPQRRVRLRTDIFDREAREAFHVETDSAVADRLGVHFTVLSMYRTGNRYCGAGFIATCQAELPHLTFEQLFEVVEVEEAAV